MGTVLFPFFDRDIPGETVVDAYNGRALAKAAYDENSALNAACTHLGIRKIEEFYAESNAEAFEKIGEDLPDDLDADEGLTWFEPGVAAEVISKILESREAVEFDSDLTQDLYDLKAAMDFGVSNNCRFRLRISF